MSFQSYWFAAFLLAAGGLYYIVPRQGRLWVILLANLIFFEWADPAAGIWLLISVCTTWAAGLWVHRIKSDIGRRAVLFSCLFVNLGLLAVFKYFPVWHSLINEASGSGLEVVDLDVAGKFGLAAPLGISFYTLQAVGYLLDVYRGKYEPEKNWLKYAAFVSFFPNILSGPIERGDHFREQLERALAASRRRLLCYDRVAQGLISMLLGYFMKLVIAERAALLVDYLYSVYESGNSFTMLAAALFYGVQIYCDFASYSCIATGVGRLFGFELLSNFRQPYFASGISDFWRRWHISLSGWLRDYVYIPLGGNRKGVFRKELNTLLVFAVSGLWHGGSPTFLVWGLGHGVWIAAEDLWHRAAKRLSGGRKLPAAWLWRGISSALTFFGVCCLWIFFRSENLHMAFVCLKNLFTGWAGFAYAKDFLFVMGLEKAEMLIAVFAAAVLFLLDVVSEIRKQETAVWIYKAPLPVRWGICLFLIGMVFVTGMYGKGFDPSSFIYVNF